MRRIGLIGRILVIFLIPLSVLSEVSDPCRVCAITATDLCRFTSILDLFLEVERTPIETTIVEVVL